MEKFDGANFHLWKFKMHMMFSKHGLWKFVDRSATLPSEEDEGMKEIGVHDNRPPSKQVKHVVDEAVNEDELVMNDNRISLKERPIDHVEGESTSNSYLDEKFVSFTR